MRWLWVIWIVAAIPAYAGRPPAGVKVTCGVWETSGSDPEKLRLSLDGDSLIIDVEDDLGHFERKIALPVKPLESGPKGWRYTRADTLGACVMDLWVKFRLHGERKAVFTQGYITFCDGKYDAGRSASSKLDLIRRR